MTTGHSKKEKQGKEKSSHGRNVYHRWNMTQTSQDQTQNSETFEPRHHRIWKCQQISTNLHYCKTLWNYTNCGTRNWNYNSKDNYDYFEVEREELETNFKKPKNGKASGEYNIPSDLCKYASYTLKTRVLTF